MNPARHNGFSSYALSTSANQMQKEIYTFLNDCLKNDKSRKHFFEMIGKARLGTEINYILTK